MLLLLIAGAAFLYNHYAPFRLSTLVLIGRSPICPLSEAVKSEENIRLQTAIKDRILNASKLVQANKGLEQWSTPKGLFWIPKGNQFVLPFNLAELERKIYGTGEQAVHSGDIVLDCGASDGDFTREALEAGAKLVVAVEIAPQNIECLRRNLAKETAAGRVIIYPKGVWDKDDVRPLNVDDQNFAADSVVLRPKGSHSEITVPLTTIDKLVAELKLERVDYIKMDIEGAEPKALAGAHDTLAKFKPRISISAYHKPGDPEEISKLILGSRPDYRRYCGPCAEADNRVRPDILYFR